jgi:hypothetical protein
VDKALNEFGATWHLFQVGFRPAPRRLLRFSRSSSH